MENKQMVINTELEMFEYLQTVNDIALEYFNIDGKYQPHIGILNAMRIFYNLCVKESKYDEEYGHDIFDATDMKEIVVDKDFIDAFNSALMVKGMDFNFGNAYRQALDIVEYKKTSLENTVDIIYKAVMNFVESFNSTVSGDTINTIVDIANKMSNNQINSETIVEAYAQSQRFKDVVAIEKSEEN